MDNAREIYDALDRTNPFAVLRRRLNMSQEELAAAVGCTVQWVYRHENGLLNTPAPAMLDYLSEHALISVEALEEHYKEWVARLRGLMKMLNHTPDRLMYGPYKDVNWLRDEHPFYAFMFNFNTHIGRTMNLDVDYRSQQLFNRFLALHPRAVQQYLGGGKAQLPPSLGNALLEVGFTQSVIEQLEREVNKYLARTEGIPFAQVRYSG